jgi:CBS domain-containing protein
MSCAIARGIMRNAAAPRYLCLNQKHETPMMLENIPVSEIMTTKVITIDMHQTLEDAAEVFHKHKIRHLPVIAYDRLVGVLSLTDLQRLSFASALGDKEANADNAIYEMLSIEQVMRIQPKTIKLGQSVRDVAELLSKEEFYALPVVNQQGGLEGIVTTTDLIRFMLQRRQQ